MRHTRNLNRKRLNRIQPLLILRFALLNNAFPERSRLLSKHMAFSGWKKNLGRIYNITDSLVESGRSFDSSTSSGTRSQAVIRISFCEDYLCDRKVAPGPLSFH